MRPSRNIMRVNIYRMVGLRNFYVGAFLPGTKFLKYFDFINSLLSLGSIHVIYIF